MDTQELCKYLTPLNEVHGWQQADRRKTSNTSSHYGEAGDTQR